MTISGIITCIRKTNTTALTHQHLKVKDIEWDISQFYYKIDFKAHELKGHAYLKIIEATFSFSKFAASSKKSNYSLTTYF